MCFRLLEDRPPYLSSFYHFEYIFGPHKFLYKIGCSKKLILAKLLLQCGTHQERNVEIKLKSHELEDLSRKKENAKWLCRKRASNKESSSALKHIFSTNSKNHLWVCKCTFLSFFLFKWTKVPFRANVEFFCLSVFTNGPKKRNCTVFFAYSLFDKVVEWISQHWEKHKNWLC